MTVKTRLWRSGLAEIVQRARERLPDSSFAQSATVAPPEDHESRPADELAKTTEFRPTQNKRPAFGRGTLIGHAFDPAAARDGAAPQPAAPKPRREMLATRLVPIESLLAPPRTPSELEPASRTQGRDLPTVSGIRRFRPTAVHLRRSLIALLGLTCALLLALPKSEPAPFAPKAAQAAAPRPGAPPTVTVPQSERVAVVAAGQPAQDASVTPRQAVDALASGDYVAAHRYYAQLASSVEQGEVYAEAARILAERIRTRSY